jgi:fatty-acyl-CoA synthase
MATRFGDRPALLSDGQSLTYVALAARIARYARWSLHQALAPGEVVGLILPNCADYAAIWLGIIAAGGVVALINPNATGDALVSAIAAVQPRHIIAGAALAPALADVQGRLPGAPRLWSHGGGPWPRLDTLVEALDGTTLRPDEAPAPALSDLALHIYTSGTTGLPKAVNVSHRRIAEWSLWFAGMIDTQPEDRMYNCLPMYHSVGGVVAIGAMLTAGGSVVIREKFSASKFWDDIAASECTVFQYIGELCRYLVNQPPNPRETQHKLRLCCGNGLRGDVWEVFQKRFAVPRILEFYASTEGNVSLYNGPGRAGAIGHIPAFLAHRFPVTLAKCDPETGALLRDEAGLCVRCQPDEIGEALGKIGASSLPGRPFEGYTNSAATEAKIARDVLAAGDAWYRTGDLMRRDRAGFYYFVDRLGDNFRWKGENIATGEVADALGGCAGVAEAVVYGVAVPGTEGRAGMAALTVEEHFDLAALYAHATKTLPDYARPVFLRICGSIAATATFKPAKALLAREGYNPANIADALYFADRESQAYIKLDAALHTRLTRGEVRV